MHRFLRSRRPGSAGAAAASSCAAAIFGTSIAGGSDFCTRLQPPWQSRQAACAATPAATASRFLRIDNGKSIELGDALESIARKQLVIFGEIHGSHSVVNMQLQVQDHMTRSAAQRLHVVLEHFSFGMQHLLDDYSDGKISMDKLISEYNKIGTENHDIECYAPLLEHARAHASKVVLHAGFIPRTYARMITQGKLNDALSEAKQLGYIDEHENCQGSELHYALFESLISGRDPHDPSQQPSDQFRKMFPAQVIKDASMAHKVNRLIDCSMARGRADQESFLVICGVGHMGYNFGVPERIYEVHPQIKEKACSIYSRPADGILGLTTDDTPAQMAAVFGTASDAADLCYLFDEECNQIVEDVKAETAAAYDRVGQTADRPGNLALAHAVMRRLGYTPAQIAVAGQDAFNYQGVGNPHRLAQLRVGDKVADLGCGLGIDSLIAASIVGPHGNVLGIDLSKAEVAHASQRAIARGDTNLQFTVGDIEKLPLADNSIDCVISNGAFCLAPNKRKAFQEIRRVLRPGGRFAVATSTAKVRLDSTGVEWPICMRTFIHIDELSPLLAQLGFEDVVVDKSDTAMQFELPDIANDNGETKANPTGATQDERGRNQVHVGSPEFAHLQEMDMNKLCARVVVAGRKPMHTTVTKSSSCTCNTSEQ